MHAGRYTERLSAAGEALRSGTRLISTLGPLFEVGRQGFPVSAAVGISPTFMSLREYDLDDFGSHFQFTSHVGLNVYLGRGWSLGSEPCCTREEGGCGERHEWGFSKDGIANHRLGVGWLVDHTKGHQSAMTPGMSGMPKSRGRAKSRKCDSKSLSRREVSRWIVGHPERPHGSYFW